MTLKRGTKIRENRQLAPVLTVLSHMENIVETYEGITLHITKLRIVRN